MLSPFATVMVICYVVSTVNSPGNNVPTKEIASALRLLCLLRNVWRLIGTP